MSEQGTPTFTGVGQGADATTAATEPVRRPDSPPTKDQVSLADLKQAIDDAAATWDDKNASDYRAAAMRAEAWRTAFEWHRQLIDRHTALSERVGATIDDWMAIDREEDEGLRLIRERLR